MALSEFWFGLSAHFYFLVAKTSLRFGMSRLIIVTPAHLTLGFLSGGLLYPKPPTISSKRSSPGKAYLDQRRGLWFRGRSLRCGRVDRPGEDGGHDGQGFATVVVSHSWWTCSVSWRIESGLLVWANGGHQPRHTLRAQPTYRGSNMGAGVKGPGETGWVGRPPYLIGSLFGLSLVRLWTVENDISRPGHGSGTRRKTGPDCRSCSWKGKEDSFFSFISCVKRGARGILWLGGEHRTRKRPCSWNILAKDHYQHRNSPDRYMSTIADMATARVLILGVAEGTAMAIFNPLNQEKNQKQSKSPDQKEEENDVS